MKQFDIIPCPVCEMDFSIGNLVHHLEEDHDWTSAVFLQLILITHRALLEAGEGLHKRLERLEE